MYIIYGMSQVHEVFLKTYEWLFEKINDSDSFISVERLELFLEFASGIQLQLYQPQLTRKNDKDTWFLTH